MPTIRSLVHRLPLVGDLLARFRAPHCRNDQVPPGARAEPAGIAQRLAAVEAELAALRRCVDLVELNGCKVYMYVTDAPYHWLPADAPRGLRLTRDEVQRVRRGNGTVEDPAAAYRAYGQRADSVDHVALVFLHYWLHDLDFAYFDIGSNIGITTMLAAKEIKKFGRKNRVVCFEPGPTASLLPWNLEINGLDDLVTFEPLAVCDFSLCEVFAGELNHSENHRCVNRDPATEGSSRVVRTTTVDDYAAQRGIGGHLIVKIDTQGGEYRVWQGMQDAVRRRYTTVKLEFTPALLSSSIAPEAFLQQVLATHHVLDTPDGDASWQFRRVREPEAAAFAREIAHRPPGWTDLLAIPKNLPGADGLLAKLARSEP